jgi:hypothetical protein
MIEAIYAKSKRRSYEERLLFWAWHQTFAGELTHSTMLEF